MYDKILVTLEGTPSDRAIIEHVKQLAAMAHSRVVLLHVADGWAARTYGPDAVQVMTENPYRLTTHGHRFIGDLFLGATASRVRHHISVPVLLLKAK